MTLSSWLTRVALSTATAVVVIAIAWTRNSNRDQGSER